MTGGSDDLLVREIKATGIDLDLTKSDSLARILNAADNSIVQEQLDNLRTQKSVSTSTRLTEKSVSTSTVVTTELNSVPKTSAKPPQYTRRRFASRETSFRPTIEKAEEKKLAEGLQSSIDTDGLQRVVSNPASSSSTLIEAIPEKSTDWNAVGSILKDCELYLKTKTSSLTSSNPTTNQASPKLSSNSHCSVSNRPSPTVSASYKTSPKLSDYKPSPRKAPRQLRVLSPQPDIGKSSPIIVGKSSPIILSTTSIDNKSSPTIVTIPSQSKQSPNTTIPAQSPESQAESSVSLARSSPSGSNDMPPSPKKKSGGQSSPGKKESPKKHPGGSPGNGPCKEPTVVIVGNGTSASPDRHSPLSEGQGIASPPPAPPEEDASNSPNDEQWYMDAGWEQRYVDQYWAAGGTWGHESGPNHPDDHEEEIHHLASSISVPVAQDLKDEPEEGIGSEEKQWDQQALDYIAANMTSTLKLDDVEAKIIKPLQEIANEIGLKGEMKLFGSFMSGFAGNKSDLDVTFIQKDTSCYLPDVLQKFASRLEKTGKYSSITKILHAQSPLIRCTNKELSVEVEVLMNNQLGVENSKLLLAYSAIDPRVAQVVRIVKTWAKNYEVLGSQDGCINSYAYVLLTLYYLVSINFLPNLQLLGQAMGLPNNFVSVKKWGPTDIIDTRFWGAKVPNFRPINTQNLSLYSLVKGFFEFYLKFPWDAYAVCLRQQIPNNPATSVLKTGLHYHEDMPPAWYVEDPFDTKHNLAGRTTESGRKRIVDAMKSVVKKFDNFDTAFQTKKNPRYWLKASISSTVTPQQVVDIFKDVELVCFHFPKLETFFQEEMTRKYMYGAPRYKNIMLEFANQASLRQAEMQNETFLCESQLRLHKTTTGFVIEEIRPKKDGNKKEKTGYFRFNVKDKKNYEKTLKEYAADREKVLAEQATKNSESPVPAASSSTSKGTKKTAANESTLNLTLPPADLGVEGGEADYYSRHASKEYYYVPGYHQDTSMLQHGAETVAAGKKTNANGTEEKPSKSGESTRGPETSDETPVDWAHHWATIAGTSKSSNYSEEARSKYQGALYYGPGTTAAAAPQAGGSTSSTAAATAAATNPYHPYGPYVFAQSGAPAGSAAATAAAAAAANAAGKAMFNKGLYEHMASKGDAAALYAQKGAIAALYEQKGAAALLNQYYAVAKGKAAASAGLMAEPLSAAKAAELHYYHYYASKGKDPHQVSEEAAWYALHKDGKGKGVSPEKKEEGDAPARAKGAYAAKLKGSLGRAGYAQQIKGEHQRLVEMEMARKGMLPPYGGVPPSMQVLGLAAAGKSGLWQNPHAYHPAVVQGGKGSHRGQDSPKDWQTSPSSPEEEEWKWWGWSRGKGGKGKK